MKGLRAAPMLIAIVCTLGAAAGGLLPLYATKDPLDEVTALHFNQNSRGIARQLSDYRYIRNSSFDDSGSLVVNELKRVLLPKGWKLYAGDSALVNIPYYNFSFLSPSGSSEVDVQFINPHHTCVSESITTDSLQYWADRAKFRNLTRDSGT